MDHRKLSMDDKVHLAIESLLKSGGSNDWNIVSVNKEAKSYCYKTVDGTIGTVSIEFIESMTL